MNQSEGAAADAVRRATPKAYFTLADEGENYANRLQLFNAIAEQIWREQQLVSNRMQWNFTFQAFLAGIFVFATSELEGTMRIAVTGVLSAVGFAVALFCLFGVIAAQKQSTRLKRHWANEFHPSPPANPGDCDVQSGAFPQPFSMTDGSNWGRRASRWVCGAMMGMWAAMFAVVVGFSQPDATSDTFVCRLEGQAVRADTFSMNCESVKVEEN